MLSTLLLLFSFNESLMVVANKSFTVDSLTTNQLQKIYLGKWTLTQNGEKIHPALLRDKEKLNQFLVDFLRKRPSQFNAYWKQSIFTGQGVPPKALDEKDLIEYLQNQEQAIAFLPLGDVPQGLKLIQIQKE